MGINLGSTAIAGIKLGTTQVDKIYLGSTQVWGGSSPTSGWGYVVYNVPGGGIATAYIQNDEEFLTLHDWNRSGVFDLTVGGETISNQDVIEVVVGDRVTVIDSYFMNGSGELVRLTLPSTIEQIGERFCSSCGGLDCPISISAINIGKNFMFNCGNFNSPITLTNTVFIDSAMLAGCASFNQDITLPSTLTHIGVNFMRDCDAMTSSVDVGSLDATIASASNNTFATSNVNAPCYTTGITIVGSKSADWLVRFPDRNTSRYRHLIDGSLRS